MRELTLHLLDLAENSVSANAKHIRIAIIEDTGIDQLKLMVEDDGKGMSPEMVQKVIDPFFTTRTTRKVGLGIPLLKAAAEACDGYLKIQSKLGEGTIVEVVFKHSHIDRMPLGNLPSTILNLVVSYPHIFWQLRYQYNNNEFVFDDELIKKELEGLSLTEPLILTYIREQIESGVMSVTNNLNP